MLDFRFFTLILYSIVNDPKRNIFALYFQRFLIVHIFLISPTDMQLTFVLVSISTHPTLQWCKGHAKKLCMSRPDQSWVIKSQLEWSRNYEAPKSV
jgi:hypothetical protein